MSSSLEGQDESLWVASTPTTNYPKLEKDTELYDLIIVGGGITGVMSAYYAVKRGLKTVLVEKSRLVEWTTGGTTAKLSSQHYLIYDYLINQQGEDTARAFATANQHGIDEVERLCKELSIDSDFSRTSAYVYTQQADKVADIQREVKVAQKIGLPASFETTIDLPITIQGAVKFENQAEFHPRKFLLRIAEEFVKNGGTIYENTEVTDLELGDPMTVQTKSGTLSAKHVIQASGKPFWKADLFDDFMWEKASYALAVKLREGSDYPKSMYITTDDPMRTTRTALYKGEQVLIFGGESHEYDEATFNPDARYEILIKDVREKYDVDSVLFRWLASDFMPYDRMPYIGALPDAPSVFVATGYRAWGLAWAVSASEALVSEIMGETPEWIAPFGLERLSKPLDESVKTHGF